MLKSFLGHSKDHLETLQLYVVAADFKKMLLRMNHSVSTHYLDCFQRLNSRSFEYIQELTQSYDANDDLFLDNIPILCEFADTEIPNLEKVAQAVAKKKAQAAVKEPFNLYNKDTCVEFHKLLCELLDRFHRSLKDLKDLEKSKVKKRKEATGIDQSDWEEITAQLNRVLALGRFLRTIVRGNAIKVHLATIAPFLEFKTGKFWPMAAHEREDAADESDDAEFYLLKPYSTGANNEPLLPWKSFHDWLRLMFHHFDAINVLDNYLVDHKVSPIEVSIKIVYPSLPDNNMLPWRELLKNEKYFPPIQHTPDQPSAAELISFLSSPTLDESENSLTELIKDVATVIEGQKSEITTGTVYAEFTDEIRMLTEDLNLLRDSSSTGWKDYLTDILGQVEGLKSDATCHVRLSRLESISNMLENLNGSFLLYKKVQPGSLLSIGKGFNGSVHCEVLSAAVSSISSGTKRHSSHGLSKDLLEKFKVSHISNPCSNLCQTLQYRQLDTPLESLNDAAQYALACSAY